MQRSLHNACALRVQKSMALDPVRGNSRCKRRLFDGKADLTLNDVDNTPLPKRKRQSSIKQKKKNHSLHLIFVIVTCTVKILKQNTNNNKSSMEHIRFAVWLP